jgi:hypothetical protein
LPAAGAPCDFVSDYLTAQVDIENTRSGSFLDQFSGEIENPYIWPTSYPSELDYHADFDVPSPTFAACAYGTLTVTGGNFYGADDQAFDATSSCWQKTLCYLGISVTNGSLLPSAQQSYYNCTDCPGFFAIPSGPNYCFRGWSGDVTSTDPTISFCFGGSDKSLTATFDVCPPSYNILISINVDGSITTLRTERYQVGATLSYSPTTPAAYRFIGWSGVVNSSQENITFQMPGQDTTLCANFTFIGGGTGDGTDSGTSNEDLPCFPGIDVNCYYTPIVINLEKGDYRLTGSNAPVLFDMAGNGHPRPMGWTAAGADEAFLWLDRNHKGKVTSGAELFGNFTPLKNGQLAKNGFEALREFDTNGDGVIDERDPIWSRLMLWRDLNHNGISEQNEILPIAGSDVTSIDLHYHSSGRHDTYGNLFKYESLVSIKNGSGHGIHKQPIYDIFFVRLPYVP